MPMKRYHIVMLIFASLLNGVLIVRHDSQKFPQSEMAGTTLGPDPLFASAVIHVSQISLMLVFLPCPQRSQRDTGLAVISTKTRSE